MTLKIWRKQAWVESSFDGARAEAVALSRGSEPAHSFFIFNAEKARGPRRIVTVLEQRDLIEWIIGLAIEVQRQIGPGLLESVYAACLAFELEQGGIPLPR